MTDAETTAYGAMLVRFDADPAEERTYARVRIAAAVLAACASLLVLLGDVPFVVFLVALLGLAISLAWFREARKAAQRAKAPQDAYLAAFTEGLLWADAPNPPIWVPWTQVTDMDVDEERVTVRVTQKDASPLHITPRYPGVEIHELVSKLRQARTAALARGST